jgi:hypothetical protein
MVAEAHCHCTALQENIMFACCYPRKTSKFKIQNMISTQENCQFQAILDYIARPWLKNKNKAKQNKKMISPECIVLSF